MQITTIEFNAAFLQQLFVLGAGISAAWLLYQLGTLALSWRSPIDRALSVTDPTPQATNAKIGGEIYKIRLFFSKLRIDATSKEREYLLTLQIVAGLIMLGSLWVSGLPRLTYLAALAAGWYIPKLLIDNAWTKQRHAIEADLPQVLDSMASIVEVSPNVINALIETTDTLAIGSPMYTWLARFTGRLNTHGADIIDDLQAEANAIGSGLGLFVFQVARLSETGGAGYAEAFTVLARNLETIMSVRAEARTKGDSAKGAARIIIGILVGVVLMFARSPDVAASFQLLAVQVIYLVLIVMVGLGYYIIADQVDEAVG